MKKRIAWDKYFIEICSLVAKRATCDRAHVGTVIVNRQYQILTTGYNGSLPGMPHCDDVGHLIENNHCIRTVHSEINAITQAVQQGISLKNAILYCNTLPCWNCIKTIVASGITEVVYSVNYRPEHLPLIEELTKTINFIFRQYEESYYDNVAENKGIE